MALSGSTVWEVRSAGADNNSGGFVAGASGTDYSQQDAAHSVRTDIVIDATTNTDITSAADAFAADDVGNIINITAGTGFTTGRYEITAVTAGVATLDRAVGTLGSTGGSGTLGGATRLTTTFLNEVVFNNVVWVKNDATHSYTTGATSAANDGTSTDAMFIRGYNTTRGDEPTGADRPTIAYTSTAQLGIGDYWQLSNVIITATTTFTSALTMGGRAVVSNVSVSSGASGYSIQNTGVGGVLMFSEVTNTGSGGGVDLGLDAAVIGCYIHDCSGVAFQSGGNDSLSIIGNIIDTCQTGIRFNVGNDFARVLNNTIYNCTIGIAHSFGAVTTQLIVNNIIDSCTTGISATTLQDSVLCYANNFSNNTTDRVSVNVGAGDTAVDPQFTDAPNGDFSVGANLNGSASPSGFFTGGLSPDGRNMGAIQSVGSAVDAWTSSIG